MSDQMERHTAMIVGLLRDSYQDTKAENKRLKDENEQLRELARALWYCSRDRLGDDPPCGLCNLTNSKICERVAIRLGVIE